MAERPGSGRLDPDILAAYVDGRLPPEDRARVEAEIAADPDTHEWLVNTIRAVDDSSAVPESKAAAAPAVLPFYRRRGVVRGLGVVLATAAALLLVVRVQPAWWQHLWGPVVDPRFAKLVAAVGEERYVEGRLSGGFQYGPLRSVARGPGDLAHQNLALLAAAGELQKVVQEDPSAENLHAWGVAQVQLGELDGAIDALRRATALEPSDPLIVSDLSVALLARGLSSRPDDLPEALEAASRASERAPDLSEAIFNRAVALEELQLTDQARQAWRAYLDADPGSPWAVEARRRLERLESEPRGPRSRLPDPDLHLDVSEVQWVREHIEDQLLPGLGRAITSGDTAASGAIARDIAARVGQLRSASDDEYVRALGDLSSVAQPSVALGLSRYGEARRLYLMDRIVDAQPVFQSAARLMGPDAALSRMARLYAAHATYYTGDIETFAATVAPIARAAEADRHAAVVGRARWALGLASAVSGRLAQAARLYRESYDAFASAGDAEGMSAVQALLAESLDLLGDWPTAWRVRIPALRQRWLLRDPRRVQFVLLNSALACTRDGLDRAALSFHDALVDHASAAGRTPLVVEAHLQRARARHRAGSPGAAQDVEQAMARLGGVDDPALRRRFEGELAVVGLEARASSSGVPDDELMYFEQHGMTARVPRLLLARATARASVDPTRAIDDLSRALSIAERQPFTPAQRRRMAAFDESTEIYEHLIELLASQDRFDEMLAVQDRARNRLSGQLAAGRGEATKSVGDAVSSAVLHFTWTRAELIAWQLSPGAVPPVRWSLPYRWRRSDRTHSSMFVGFTKDPAFMAWLSERVFALVRPLPADLPVAIVADGPLHSVSFGALRDPETGRFLIEDRDLVVLTSLAAARDLDRALMPAAAPPPRHVLVVGNPSSAEALPALPNADREARAVAARYPGSTLLLGDDATRAAVVDGMTRHDVLHFTGHAVVNELHPALSRLVLASVDSLYAHEIASLASTVDLVVLGACAAAGGVVRTGAGIESLTSSFGAAGAPAVVAPIEPVDDRVSAELLIVFHEQLRAGLPPAQALRRAQLDRMAAGDDIKTVMSYQFHWAGVSEVQGPDRLLRARGGSR